MALPAEKERLITALERGEIRLFGQFLNSSNFTFLGELVYEELTLRVVYKPMRGEQPLWDFPVHSLTRREAAAFVVSEGLGWDLVPPTVYRKQKAPLGQGSLQLFIEHDPNYHYFEFKPSDRQRLRSVALFDVLINNADRKGGHILFDASGHLWVIDHGVCFAREDKLRTVVWDFTGEEPPPGLLGAIESYILALQARGKEYETLRPLLRVGEIQALIERGKHLLETRCFPPPSTDRRSYPWPPV